MITRESLRAALDKPVSDGSGIRHLELFDPWEDVIKGIYGSYNSMSDDLFIDALEAVRDRWHSAFMDKWGFAGEFALYVLAGHGLTEYGTSPRYAWPDPKFADMWDELIEKWKAYRDYEWADSKAGAWCGDSGAEPQGAINPRGL